MMVRNFMANNSTWVFLKSMKRRPPCLLGVVMGGGEKQLWVYGAMGLLGKRSEALHLHRFELEATKKSGRKTDKSELIDK
jgi:hypothetical protein